MLLTRGIDRMPVSGGVEMTPRGREVSTRYPSRESR